VIASPAPLLMPPFSIVAYLALFAATGAVFIFVALLLGRLLRPRAPSPEKAETYECGELPVGSSFVQFDLRFYVVALVFIIFEVEVAFFFPWAVVFGKANQLRGLSTEQLVATSTAGGSGPGTLLDQTAADALGELGVQRPETISRPGDAAASRRADPAVAVRNLALIAMADMAVFFGVLLVGFAYVWRRGDLDWVRAIGGPGRESLAGAIPTPAPATTE
jgi:NADH-quinone oxidoreductase subunit A